MDKHEKYYNYIVDDLVNKTQIDNYAEYVIFPFKGEDGYFYDILPDLPPPTFESHTLETYGLGLKETDLIWSSFKEKLEPLIQSNDHGR